MKTQIQNFTKAIITAALFQIGTHAYSQTFTNIATDVATDVGAYSTYPDGGALSYYYDNVGDSLWFRVSIISNHSTSTFGMNIFIDTDNNQSTGNAWWGTAPQNATFKYEKYLTAWVSGGPNFTGTIGIGDYGGSQMGTPNYTNLAQNNLVVKSDGSSKTFTLGVKRSAIGSSSTINVIAVVGTNQYWNDAVPNTGYGTITITGIHDLNNSLNIQTYPIPATDKITIQGLEKGKAASVSIFNILGESVYTGVLETITSPLNEINVSTLAKGTYILQVTQNELTKTSKIIIGGN